MACGIIVPDTHTRPGVSNKRFKALANYVKNNKIEFLIFLGDHWDMNSLCTYDSDNADFKNRSFREDIDVGLEALDLVGSETNANVDKIFLLGNHEYRTMKLKDKDTRFSAEVNFDRPLNYLDKNNWKLIPYTKQARIHGVTFSHNFFYAHGERSIAGEYVAANIVKKKHASCVCGHSHVYSYYETPTVDGTMLQGLVAGCFLEPGDYMNYAGRSQDRWWSGITTMNFLGKGEFDFGRISTKQLIKDWA